jgi:hypothetical protein
MYFGECLNNQIIYEFNFKEALSTLKNKIKQAILKFLDKLENWLKKGKDNKVKQFVLGLVQKTKKLLTKVDKANTQDKCKEVSDELNKYSKEFNEKVHNNGFEPSRFLQRTLDASPRNIYDIIGALMGYINADPGFKTDDFDKAIKYVLSQGVSKNELFEDFNPKYDFEEDQSKWDEDYYSFARVYLKDNFCEKRINHVKAVGKKVK